MRQQDELIPMRHGVIGQETQGPGGMMMSFRSIAAMQSILADLDEVSPRAVVFNYTNPVNIVSQAVTSHSDRLFYSMCEGPMIFWPSVLRRGSSSRAKTCLPRFGAGCTLDRRTSRKAYAIRLAVSLPAGLAWPAPRQPSVNYQCAPGWESAVLALTLPATSPRYLPSSPRLIVGSQRGEQA